MTFICVPNNTSSQNIHRKSDQLAQRALKAILKERRLCPWRTATAICSIVYNINVAYKHTNMSADMFMVSVFTNENHYMSRPR